MLEPTFHRRSLLIEANVGTRGSREKIRKPARREPADRDALAALLGPLRRALRPFRRRRRTPHEVELLGMQGFCRTVVCRSICQHAKAARVDQGRGLPPPGWAVKVNRNTEKPRG